MFFGGKNVKICDFGQKMPSDFGEDFFFFFFGDYLILDGEFVISARKCLRKCLFFWRSPVFGRKISDFGQKMPSDFGEDLFFFLFWRSLVFGRKICDFGLKKPSDFGENLCPPDLNFVPPILRSWRRPWIILVKVEQWQAQTTYNDSPRTNNVTRVRVKPRSCSQGRHKNDAFAPSATLTITRVMCCKLKESKI